jgi:hypothetical protein
LKQCQNEEIEDNEELFEEKSEIEHFLEPEFAGNLLKLVSKVKFFNSDQFFHS